MRTKIPRYNSDELLDPVGIEILSFEELYKQKIAIETIYDEHRTAFYHVFRYTGERNIHYIQGKKIVLGNNTLLIINRNIMHRYAKPKCTGNMILFDITFAGSTQAKVDFLNHGELFQYDYLIIPMLSENFITSVDRYFSLMKKRYPIQGLQETENMIQRNWLHNLLITIEREYREQKQQLAPILDTQDYVQQFRTLLDVHYQTQKQIRFYADQLNLSEKKLSQIVYNAHGISAKEYINEKIVSETVRLLKNTTLNQGEIAGELGFDFTYFIKFFRKRMGTTPAKYRQMEGMIW